MFQLMQLILFILVGFAAQFETENRNLFTGLATIGIVKVIAEYWLRRRSEEKSVK
jgi:ABC-type iron transport system FetAB permease component